MINSSLIKLFSRPIAHRGLWGNGVTENTIKAFSLAIENGFNIETDVFLSKDGELFCCHDNNLSRLAGLNDLITNKTSKEIKEINLINGGKIPTLKELLELTKGKVFLLIEIKNQKNRRVVDKTIELLKTYGGEFAIQSFNPFFLKRVKNLAPNFLRGILSDNAPDTKNLIEKFVVKSMAFNFLCRPHFISYNFKGLNNKKLTQKNLPVIAWTITNKKEEILARKRAKNIIFEGYISN